MRTAGYEHCPHCGEPLASLDPPTAYHCDACEDYVFDNPPATARVAVVDGEEVLLVEIADDSRLTAPPHDGPNEWSLPGGHVLVPEQPADAAARELEEETGLAVDPDALELIAGRYCRVVEGHHGLTFVYAVAAAETEGPLESGDDAADARFWSPADLDAAAHHAFRELHHEPAEHRDLAWWRDRAREATRARDSGGA